MKYESLAYIAEMLRTIQKEQRKEEEIQEKIRAVGACIPGSPEEKKLEAYREAYMETVAQRKKVRDVFTDFCSQDWR